MLLLVGVAFAVLSLALALALGAYFRASGGQETPQLQDPHGREALEAVRGIERWIDGELAQELGRLRAAIAEGIAHEERREARINATVRRARKSLEDQGLEHAGLEGEVAQLQLLDGGLGSGSAVPSVSAPLEEAGSSIPGVPRDLLSRARGRA